MLTHVQKMTVLRDTALPGHCPLRIDLDFPEHLDSKFVYRTPLRIQIDRSQLNIIDQERIEKECWSTHNDFYVAIQNHDVDQAFNIWTQTAEQILIQTSKSQGHTIFRKH